MKPVLLDYLRCVACQRALDLEVLKEAPVTLSAEERDILTRADRDLAGYERDIDQGVLSCKGCDATYPVYGGVPRMYRGADKDFTVARAGTGSGTGHLPNNRDEVHVQASFSREWDEFDYDDNTIWLWTKEERIQTFLEELSIDSGEELRGKQMVDCGCGPAVLSMALAERFGVEIIAFDMSYIIGKAHQVKQSNLIHFVQGSVLSPPLAEQFADIVYSHGVLHHTSSTRRGFDAICRFTKPGGWLYVWLYGKKKGWNRFRFFFIRNIRYVVARLPKWPQVPAVWALGLVHAVVRFGKRLAGVKQIPYRTWGQFIVGIRDKYTPKYAREHTEREVIGWFREAGYEDVFRRTDWPQTPVWNGSTDLAIRGTRATGKQDS